MALTESEMHRRSKKIEALGKEANALLEQMSNPRNFSSPEHSARLFRQYSKILDQQLACINQGTNEELD